MMSMCLFNSSISKAQITFDYTVDSTFYGYLFYPAKIGNNETKYVFLDTVANVFSLYNIDFSPFLLNISVPHPLHSFAGPYEYFYHIMYISRTLFDCDSTNIEYLFSSQDDPFHPLWVMRTDGTVLFLADSSRAPYCLGCPGGTSLLRPILETELGTKLVIMKDYQTTTGARNISFYSLCGSLPNGIQEFDFTGQGQQNFVKVFPNPNAGELSFDVSVPDNLNNYELRIVDNNLRELRSQKIKNNQSIYHLNVNDFATGTYYYSLSSNKTILQSGKFILNK